MPQLLKRKGSQFYYARFQLNGKDRWLSTEETDSKKARKKLIQLRAQARNEVSIEEQLKILLALVNALSPELQAATTQPTRWTTSSPTQPITFRRSFLPSRSSVASLQWGFSFNTVDIVPERDDLVPPTPFGCK